MPEAWKEILAGSVGGIVQVLVGQPFDTVKVRLQSNTVPYSGTFDCIQKTLQKEGPLAFYKGTLSPLMGIAFCVSIQFGVLEEVKRRFTRMNQGQKYPQLLSNSQLFLAGACAGVANSIISGPVEHIRTRMQVQTNEKLYQSTLDAYSKIYQKYGISGIYKGQLITIVREFFGYGAYFLAYEWLVQKSIQQNGQILPRDQLPTYKVLLFGAAAGFSMWYTYFYYLRIPFFPIDVVKSKLQTDSLDFSKRKYKSAFDCMKQILKTEGIAGFYRGFLPCLLRAAPVNASTFLAYELALGLLK